MVGSPCLGGVEEGVTIDTGFCEGALSARLYYRHLVAKDARAQLVILHGFGEHSGRYEQLMTERAEHGLSSLAIDYRGHGRADGRRGHVNRFSEYLTDADRALAIVADKHNRMNPPIQLPTTWTRN